ncbi:MAG: hypothetical protein ACREFF_16100 [Candidatus Udaeobacter sp.]
MSNEKTQPESTEKEKREIELRDLKPKTDPKGGAAKGEKKYERSTDYTGRDGKGDFWLPL